MKVCIVIFNMNEYCIFATHYLANLVLNKLLKKLSIVFLVIFVLLNVVAYTHAYNFTHFQLDSDTVKTKSPEHLSFSEKLKILFIGITNPKPLNTYFPSQPFQTVVVNSNEKIETWYISQKNAKGTVIVFHGYLSNKSLMLDRSNAFYEMGYNVLLVDFMGTGGSEGNTTTIGFKEAIQVKDCYNYVQNLGEKNIILFGTSMGTAAILKSIHDDAIKPKAIVLECPFGSMSKTVGARFKNMNIPQFPMKQLLVFWGGIQHGFWAFEHNPQKYAESVNCSVLLFYGEMDKTVSKEESKEIFNAFKGKKELVLFPNASHENYFKKYKTEWLDATSKFLE